MSLTNIISSVKKKLANQEIFMRQIMFNRNRGRFWDPCPSTPPCIRIRTGRFISI